jgi:hypothetical protein
MAAGHREPAAVYGDGSAGHRIAELLASCELRIDKRLTYEVQGAETP